MKRPPRRAGAALTLALCLLSAPALAFERIAVVAPIGDRHAILGKQAVAGAREALGLPPVEFRFPDPEADAATPEASGGLDPGPGLEDEAVPAFETLETPREVQLVVVNDPCRGGEEGAADGAAVAQALVEANVDAVVGLVCWSTLEPALREGTLDGIPLITSGVRAGALTDRRRAEGWDVWRVAPRVEDEADRIVRHIMRAWRGRPYAVLDDGTIYGRELAERVSTELLRRGSEPVMRETYRPAVSRQVGLARRIGQAGATHVFVAGERRDVAIIARDAVVAGLDLTIFGGDAMRAIDDDVALPAGVEAVLLGPALNSGYRETTRAAVETLLAAETLALEKGFSLEDALNTGEFETVIGSVRFDRLGDLRRNLFVHAEWNGERWVVTPGSSG